MLRTILKISLFIALLLITNLYLLNSGIWFFQDASGWPKNTAEAYQLFISPFYLISNDFYYSYNQGLLSYLNLITTAINFMLISFFGASMGQILLFLLGYISAFFSFYLFCGLFFKNKDLRFALSLIFTFNPLVFNLQGTIIIYAAAPLYLYSFYRYFFSPGKTRYIYLLINILSAFLWIAYIRLFQANFFIIVPYIVYFFIRNERLDLKKIFTLAISYFIIFLPLIYTISTQILEKSSTAFNYGTGFKNITEQTFLPNAFNIFNSFNFNIYENRLWQITGLVLYIYFVYLLITYTKKRNAFLLSINFLILFSGIACYGLGAIFGDAAYSHLIKVLPFITNGAYWALYITIIPFLIILGIVTEDKKKTLYLYSAFFVILAISPFLFLSDFHFKKFNLSQLPNPYYEYFVKPYNGVSDATLYFPRTCWRAKYMDIANVPTQCFNFGNHYAPINYDNPRFLSGDTLQFSQMLYGNTNIDNLRVLMNLKNVIISTDIIHERDKQGKIIDQSEEINSTKKANGELKSNPLLSVTNNKNFNHYYFTEKNSYDFLLYSPKIVIRKEFHNVLDNSLKIEDLPIVMHTSLTAPRSLQNPTVYYKLSSDNPTFYAMRIANIQNSEKFILQLNQTYNKNFKIKLVDKKYFDSLICKNNWKSFPATKNFQCQYNNTWNAIKNITLINNPEIKTEQHLQGNLIGNAWILNPKDLPKISSAENDLYAVIILENQLWYTMSIVIAGSGLIIISSLAVWQALQRKNNKK